MFCAPSDQPAPCVPCVPCVPWVPVGKNIEDDGLLGDGEAQATSPDKLIAAKFARELFAEYSKQIDIIVTDGIDHKLMPLMQEFYRSVAQIPIE
jgi:hypothetical protein